MAEIDEDTPITLLHTKVDEDDDPSDETPDFRLLAALNTKSGQLPKRGEKDFEQHGTKHQDGILEASRQAMHDALAHTRFHIAKNHTRAFYYGDGGSLLRDDVVPPEWRKGLEDDHVVVLETAKGIHWKSMGKSTTGQKRSSIWLLPEEALYLVERGNLDLWWPTRSSFNGVYHDKESEDNVGGQTAESEEQLDEGFPMSLQAAYALLIGKDGERGRVTLERYNVYTNLKRSGYVVLRAPAWDATKAGEKNVFEDVPSIKQFPSMFSWLFGSFFSERGIQPQPLGPLVKPGMYRSYNAIYRQIAIIPRHKPAAVPQNPSSPPEDPYRVVFHIWKPSSAPTFTKTNPGLPDVRVAVTNSRSTLIPTLRELTSLLESTPWDPPGADMIGPSKLYQRLKHGWRNVVLAVIDQGVISYLRLGETAFGEEKLCERFDQGIAGGNKRGGGAGRGGRGGRGRGRGRGR
ncbi:hypothetical protein HYFRA_00009357 [Hymenoscyphus fraxineus]|uniref:tRNA-splicing endonuclease subunit Sen54 N-terminal domain-containing protein n=1 Tax=Hymenoscyphus fraxineus TaxID=746836 RepID=A0A9N9PRP9_9HELO|nr:hypothetical protein HYFRA_00009357 [Hymenoscyphus fraxineus]